MRVEKESEKVVAEVGDGEVGEADKEENKSEDDKSKRDEAVDARIGAPSDKENQGKGEKQTEDFSEEKHGKAGEQEVGG